ncbi:MAG TPA: hypothetical protein VEF76_09695 [Patescibacteria group bacterium]|nr:hypothetical protein [Patescibacteria group bacterium]
MKTAFNTATPEMITAPDGSRRWLLNNVLHRDDGPAIIGGMPGAKGGSGWFEEWYRHGLRHRDNGPAVEYEDGYEWYRNGKLHREDGPAYKTPDGEPLWYLEGRELSPAEIHRLQQRQPVRQAIAEMVETLQEGAGHKIPAPPVARFRR